jgi:3-methyladenine DNA glycosylase AlkD
MTNIIEKIRESLRVNSDIKTRESGERFFKEDVRLYGVRSALVEKIGKEFYGWMLKAASQAHQQDVFDFVVRNKAVMPRTALRYAIEKMPPELKSAAMQKALPG